MIFIHFGLAIKRFPGTKFTDHFFYIHLYFAFILSPAPESFYRYWSSSTENILQLSWYETRNPASNPIPKVVLQYFPPMRGVPIALGIFQNITNCQLSEQFDFTHPAKGKRYTNSEFGPCPVIGWSIISNDPTEMRVIVNQLQRTVSASLQNGKLPRILRRVC